MERKLTRIDIPWCNACQEKECHSSDGECAMIRIYKKAKTPTQNPWCDICGKDDCDKIICGFTTCELAQKHSELIAYIKGTDEYERVECPHTTDEWGYAGELPPCGECPICKIHQS